MKNTAVPLIATGAVSRSGCGWVSSVAGGSELVGGRADAGETKPVSPDTPNSLTCHFDDDDGDRDGAGYGEDALGLPHSSGHAQTDAQARVHTASHSDSAPDGACSSTLLGDSTFENSTTRYAAELQTKAAETGTKAVETSSEAVETGTKAEADVPKVQLERLVIEDDQYDGEEGEEGEFLLTSSPPACRSSVLREGFFLLSECAEKQGMHLSVCVYLCTHMCMYV